MTRAFSYATWSLAILSAIVPLGCGVLSSPSSMGTQGNDDVAPTGLTAKVADRALEVGEQIGGADGFGGARMNGFMGHMPRYMGFQGPQDLGTNGGSMTVTLRNESDRPCTFFVAYLDSSQGIDDQTDDVTVPAGDSVTIDMPCAEILGLGSLTEVGEDAVLFDDGQVLDNRLCVPGFLGADYDCAGTYRFTVTPDVDDLDGDGDTTELIAISRSLTTHMEPGGMMQGGHMGYGPGGSMMGRFNQ